MFVINNTSSYPVTFSYHGAFEENSIRIPENSTRSFNVPNGYYRVSLNSDRLHTRGIYEVVTCNDSYKSYDLDLVRDYKYR